MAGVDLAQRRVGVERGHLAGGEARVERIGDRHGVEEAGRV